MNQPSLTIETVHGIKETVVFDTFTVGPTSSESSMGASESNEERSDQHRLHRLSSSETPRNGK